MSSVKSSLESLYKSLYIVGLFLLACGIAISWKSFDLTLAAKQQMTQSEIELCKSRTEVSIRYHNVRDGFRKLEYQFEPSVYKRTKEALLSKCIFPISTFHGDGSQQAKQLHDAKSLQLQKLESPIERWINKVESISEHRDRVEIGLAQMGDDLSNKASDIAKEQLERISNSIKELQDSISSLAASEQQHASAMAANKPEATAQPTITIIAIAFIVAGMTVVGRVTVRWCNDIFPKQESESKDLEMTGNKLFGELFQFNRGSVIVSSLVGFFSLLVFLPPHFDSISEKSIPVPSDILDVPEFSTAPLYVAPMNTSSKGD